MNGQLRREQFEARIVIASAVLAMVIALLGLYALVAATVVKRVKEIGVRKVMGADRMTIVRLLLWQFTKPVVLANLLAWPLGYWAVMQWLQRFPYQIDMQLIVQSGLAASAVALFIAWLTVGFMAAKAASVKPVLALRYE
jgi:putative ABC transport system permease protein